MSSFYLKVGFIGLFMAVFIGYSQSNVSFETKRLQYKDALTKQAKNQWITQEVQDGNSAFADSILEMIYVDTFVLNQLQVEMQRWDGSTLGINQANMYTASDYEALVLKYSEILAKKLTNDDKKIYLEAQNAWLAFYEKERAFCGVLMKPEYNGGGSIQTIYYTERLLQLQKSRLEFVVSYLTLLV